jgi:hypothetical protein
MREVEWDEAKRRANLEKHGADFADVPFMEWDNATILEDTRFDNRDSGRSECSRDGFIWWRYSRAREQDSRHQLSQSKCTGDQAPWQQNVSGAAASTTTFRR